MKKGLLIALGIVLVIGGGSAAYYFGSYKPHQEAISSFKIAYAPLKKENKVLNKEIKIATELTQNKKTPLDSSVTKKLKKTISSAKDHIIKVPTMPSKTAEINKSAKKAVKPNYSVDLNSLKNNSIKYKESVHQRELVTNPNQNYVIGALKKVSTITGTQAVTEDNDPNESLNKAGGYTAAIYFTSSLVTEEVEGTDIIDKGTDAGGCIEVYKNTKDATKRNSYLSSFDGAGIMDSGSHELIGTVIIRTSSKLTATQQKNLSTDIKNELTRL